MRKPEEREAFFTLILKRMNEMAGAFNFFTGDLKESQMCAAQHCKSCPSSLEGWHLPELFLLVVKSQASASLSPHWDAGDPMSWSITSFAPAQLHHSHNYLSSHPGSAHAGAWDPCSSPPRRGVQVSGSDKAGLAVVSLGRTRKRVVRPAPAHLFPLDSLHKKSCRKSI